jgi:hypothetical protein
MGTGEHNSKDYPYLDKGMGPAEWATTAATTTSDFVDANKLLSLACRDSHTHVAHAVRA